MTTCLLIWAMLFCAETAVEPPGSVCITINAAERVCTIPGDDITELPMRYSTYDPRAGGINCNGDCSHFATGRIEPEHWRTTAACPIPMLWQTVTTAEGSWVCRDTGGAVVPTFAYVWTGSRYESLWFVPIDLLWPSDDLPGYAYSFRQEWEIE